MSLMRALRGVATGYLGARVDQMNALAKAKAEEKKFNDQLKANEASTIRLQDNELKKREEINAEKEEKLADEAYRVALGELGDEGMVEQLKLAGKLKNIETYEAWKSPWQNYTGEVQFWNMGNFIEDFKIAGGTQNTSENSEKSLVDINNLSTNVAKSQVEDIETGKYTGGIQKPISVKSEEEITPYWATQYKKLTSPPKPTKPEFMTDLNLLVNGVPTQRLVTIQEMIAEPLRYVPYTAKDEKVNKDLGVTDFRKITESNLETIFPGKTGYQTGMQDGVQVSTFRFFGNDQEQEAIRGYNNSFTTALTLVEAYKNAEQELPEDLVNNLNLYSTDANVASPTLIGNSVANLFADVKEDLTENFSSQIDEMQQIQKFETFREITSLNKKEFINTYGNEYIDIYSQAKANGLTMKPILVAQSLADVSMGEIKTFDELVVKRDLIQEGKERTLNIQKEDDMSFVRYYPEFSTDESVKEFVDGYLTADNLGIDDNNKTSITDADVRAKLILDLKELTKSEYDFMLLVEEAEKYIESIDPDNFQKTPITNQENLNVDIDAQTEELIEEEEPTTKKLTVKGKEYGETEVDVDEKTDINTLITTRDNLINQIENETNNVQKKRLSSKLKTIEREIKKLQGN